MKAFFDSPDTIRNKINEFRTATFNGINKQDVMSYLSTLSEQQGVLIRLLKENNIPLLVDDGYKQEEIFTQPEDGSDEYIAQYNLTPPSDEFVENLKNEISMLRSENEKLKNSCNSNVTEAENNNDGLSLPAFDVMSDSTSSNDEVERLKQELEEKMSYIEELENQLMSDNGALATSEIVSIDEDLKNKYELRIQELENQLSEREASGANNLDLLPDLDVFQDNTLGSNNEEEISLLKETIENLRKENDSIKEQLESLNNTKNNDIFAQNNMMSNGLAPITESLNDEDQLESLKANVEILEMEVCKINKEKREIEIRLEEKIEELKKYTTYTDENNNITMLDPKELADKSSELDKLQNEILKEKTKLEEQLIDIEKREAIIENNKHLLSDDYVEKVTAKEKEVEMLRKQMDKMLLVAQATAEETEKESKEQCEKIVSEAKAKAEEIIQKATTTKENMESEARDILENAKETKSKTEAELESFREETRKNAENMIIEAKAKVEEVITNANLEAEQVQKTALEEVQKIMSQAEEKVSEIDKVIEEKQKEVETIHKHYLKVKNDGLVSVKKLYNQLEEIIYSDDLT